MSSTPQGRIRWIVGSLPAEFESYAQIRWAGLRGGWIAEARRADRGWASITSPAQPWLDWLLEVDELAVTDVVLDEPAALGDLLGFVVEPAKRLGIDLIVVANASLHDLDDADFVETGFGYPYALDRLRWLVGSARPRRVRPAVLSDSPVRLDRAQQAAVDAGAGVVQIIAPAGSGKTAVLVERVRELRRRGVPAEAIACVTFNRAAAGELERRFTDGGVGRVEALTFHGLGRRILLEARELRKHVGRQPSISGWRALAYAAKQAAGEHGVWLSPGDGKALVSEIKLGARMSPEEYAETINERSDDTARTVAALYAAYEDRQREDDAMDFDDLILCALRLVGRQKAVRERWQQQWECLLVDEYQDIEPAQELLVRILAAPHDQLFCVGDEDQTLYAFRRASVEHIIRLDGHYPGLRRIPLEVNYRCPGRVVVASDRLIAANRVRFPKRIAPAPGRELDGTITLREVTSPLAAAADVAVTLSAGKRGEMAVLARTTNALRPVALACADQGVPIDGPSRLFTAGGARRALADHLLLAIAPRKADGELVRAVCSTPSRNLRKSAESVIAKRLRHGMTFVEAFADVPAPLRGRGALASPGDLFSELSECANAQFAVALLRERGGLDDWFEQGDAVGGPDSFECETLEQAESEARGLSLDAYLAVLRRQAEELSAIRDEVCGIELATVHGAKGRQWPHVIVVSCDDGTLPHARAIKVSAEELARGEGLEAERRLAYVAFTRAGEHLELHYSKERPSQFLVEAGLLGADRPSRSRPARRPPPAPQPPSASRTSESVYARAPAAAAADPEPVPAEPDNGRPGRPPEPAAMAPDRQPGPTAVRARRGDVAELVGQRRLRRRTTIGGLSTMLGLTESELASLLGTLVSHTVRTKLRRLDADETRALADSIRRLA